MDWAKDYYTRQSANFGQAAVTEAHRRLARLLDPWCHQLDSCTRLLELGAGAGGLAAALVDLGYDVTAVEFNAPDAAFARELAAARPGKLHVVEGDFYDVSIDGPFDLVYYWDGFGIGSDDDQRRLLRRIASDWVAPKGCAVIDVFSPWNWMKRDGDTRGIVDVHGKAWERRLEYDVAQSRFRDFWTSDDREPALSQTIRCYTIPEFELLVRGTGLRVADIFTVDCEPIDLTRPSQAHQKRLVETNGYFARLFPEDPATA